MEPSEMREFSEQMQEAGEKSMTYVSLIISVLAVLVAMVTVLGHRTHTEATLMQTRAGDKWNEYQARKLRLQEAANTNMILARLGAAPKQETTPAEDEKPADAAQMEKWRDENKEAQVQAKEFEEKVELAEARASRYDLGEALLQIAVILASITLLTRKSLYVLTAVVLGVGGLVVAASAFLVH